MRIYYVYKLIDPNLNIPKYIGITNDCKRRFRQHISDTSKTKKVNWINVLKSEEKLPLIEVIDTTTSIQELIALEKKYIKEYSEQYELVNSTLGGEYHCYGTPIQVFDLNGNYIDTYTSMIEYTELYNLPATAVSGISSVCLRKRNYAYFHIFRYIGDTVTQNDILRLKNTINQRNPKHFYILNLNGEVLDEFNSIQEAQRKGYGKAYRIGQVLNNIPGNNSINNLIPCYFLDEFAKRKEKYIAGLSKNSLTEVISKYDLNGDLLNTYNTYSDAVRDTPGTNIFGIKQVCLNKYKQCGGYLWAFGNADKISSFCGKLPRKSNTSVAQYSLDGTLIKIWSCCAEAAKCLNVDRNALTRAACHNKVSNQYIWKYIQAQ